MRLFPLLVLTLAAGLLSAAGNAEDGIVAVRLGRTIERTLEQAKADGYAYAPKQEAERSGETRIYLPYGSNRRLYHQVVGQLTDPRPGACAEFVSEGGDRAASLTYRLVFDKPIASFRCRIGYTELVQAPESVAGLAYSIDGKAWKPVREHPKGTKAVVSLCDDALVVTGLNTRLLLLRMYACNSADPTAATGPEMYLKTRISGDPAWGDAATTFFNSQNQVWVTAR